MCVMFAAVLNLDRTYVQCLLIPCCDSLDVLRSPDWAHFGLSEEIFETCFGELAFGRRVSRWAQSSV